jgi:hypothetical protein
MKTAFAVVFAVVIGLYILISSSLLGIMPGMYWRIDQLKTENAELREAADEYETWRMSSSGAIWEGYYNSELNVRYRGAAGDDGLKKEWERLRSKYAKAYADGSPTRELAIELYTERVRVCAKEGPEINAESMFKVTDQLDADVAARRWPQ